ncbi:MAG: HD-GYP domain-containing protein [Peptococcaceae bacterium]|nr:HD-GYP domain-containing protein [Peptococcaceae bacterium]
MAIVRLTDELKPGMTLEQDIYNMDKVLLLAKGAVLTQENIKTIKRLGYTEVEVRKPPEKPEYWNRVDEKKVMEFKKSYSESGEEVADLIRRISDGQQVNLEQAYQLPGSILQEVNRPYNLFPSLSQVEQLDHHTYGHSINVSLICAAICHWLQLEEEISRDVVVAGLLHDIGKSRLNPDLFYKSQLTLKELEEFKKHTTIGFKILEEAKAPEAVQLAALHHHEREDGSGYPGGLTGDRIPLAAKIVAVADVYDTMNSSRPGSGRACPFKVFEEMQSNFLGALDTKILITFLARTAECYVGEIVRLNDGRTGQIVVINRTYPSRPMIRVDDEIIDLSQIRTVEIEEILPVTG